MMEELMIYYEEETRQLRSRIEQQNREIVELYNQIGLRYRLYSSLEEDYNILKGEFELFKKDTIVRSPVPHPCTREPLGV